MLPIADLLAFDRDHLWHPYASALSPAPTHLVESASGVRLRLQTADGDRREVIDGMASWWCAIHGYAVPELDAAARSQLDSMSHVMFGGLTHEPAITLADKLIRIAPGDSLQHVFFADSGSVSVEVALKMAWQAHAAAGRPRTKAFTVRGGYHGDTLSPMSVCDPVNGMHTLFRGVLPEQVFGPRPPGGLDADISAWEAQTRGLFEQHASDIAAVIVEPVLQGAGGMWIYPPQVVRVLASLARSSGALLIFDEIATGFGRTGTLWAADRCEVTPDILCVGKALTGGYLSLAAVLCTADVAAAVSAEPAGALMHGPTFMANPLACAIASASIDLLGDDLLDRVNALGEVLSAAIEPARDLPGVADVRSVGAVGVIQLDSPRPLAAASAAALDHGVWLRPFNDLVYAMPPYACTPDEVAQIGAAMVAAARAVAP
ncbi:adenosylmethionine--8-amino-7-oxononanoate transaminase [Calidifontibacter indicus]|uniref:Adenosylmethionine-8-amino-7-oxononanoate aminotransferase n=1 Tax=Calidifontibacter indicus TaxID=419650 RepID=A0A3D9UJX4_9MICO|nr:adenosylmethionine-8-amino-7-oxononanoate aminotransferase [Calidifontibacter indicus]